MRQLENFRGDQIPRLFFALLGLDQRLGRRLELIESSRFVKYDLILRVAKPEAGMQFEHVENLQVLNAKAWNSIGIPFFFREPRLHF